MDISRNEMIGIYRMRGRASRGIRSIFWRMRWWPIRRRRARCNKVDERREASPELKPSHKSPGLKTRQ